MPSFSPFHLAVAVLFTASALSGFFKAEISSYQDCSRKSSSFDFRGGLGPGKRQGDGHEGPDFSPLDLHLSPDPVGGNSDLCNLPRFEKMLRTHLLIVLDGIILMP